MELRYGGNRHALITRSLMSITMTLTVELDDLWIDGHSFSPRDVAALFALASTTRTRTADDPDSIEQGPFFVSIPAAAKALGVGRSFVYAMLERNELPSKRFGRRRLIPVVALQRLALETVGPRPQ
jgi:excisionase family DNA binding protein